jgi:hypothetical protein
VVASAAAGAAPACAEFREAPTCASTTTARPFAARVPDCAPAFRAAAKPRRRRRGGSRVLAGGGDGGSWGGNGGGFGGDSGDSRWWGEPQQPEGGDSMLWHTLSALSLLAGVQHLAHRALVRAS